MPKAKPKPVKPVNPITEPTIDVESARREIEKNLLKNMPVLYDKVETTEYSTTSAKGPLTIADMKKLVGWQTEKDYQALMVQERGGKPEHYLFGETFHCKNVAGEKVRLLHNAHNRPFDESWCEDLIHTILYGQWAGPHTLPGETVNGETIRISRYGRVLSGQHQMTAAILANEWLHKARVANQDMPDDPKYPAWRSHGETFLETIVVTGMSEDPRVLMTVDYVKPRTASDVFYTSDVFKNCTPPERKELCKILASAVDTLWTRTDAKGYKTHPEVVGFLERHKKLLNCAENIFNENRQAAGRAVSKLRLQTGTCAAIMFIQGSSGPGTDPEYGDVYRNDIPPSQKGLDWSYWNKAEAFWTLLASGRDFAPVRTAMARLVDSSTTDQINQGMGGRVPEKLAIVAKAWELWKDHPDSAGPPFTDDDLAPGGALCLAYSTLDDTGKKLPDGEIKLLDNADFYGIDAPATTGTKASREAEPMPVAPTAAEIEKAKMDALERRQQQTAKK